MGLKANGRLTNLLPLRHRGALGFEVSESSRASRRNVYVGGINGNAAIPNGAQPESSIVMAETAGGIAAYTTVFGVGTIGGAGAAGLPAQAALIGVGIISGAGVRIIQGASSLSGFGDITAQARATISAQASLVGLGVISGSGVNVIQAVAALGGLGDLTAQAKGLQAAQASLVGLGTLSATGLNVLQAVALLTGNGDLSAQARATIDAQASLTGLGILFGIASARQIVSASAALSGQGSIDATWSALAGLVSTLQGTGTIGAAPYAPGTLAANITSLDPLSPGALADRVWNGTAIEGAFTAAQLLKLVSAVLAGKTNIVDLGGGNATVTFRDVNDLRNRLVASMTGSQRTSITKDVA